MVLNYLGEGCFRLQSGELSLLVNPSSNRLKSDVVLKTLSLSEDPLTQEEIAHAGEYESKGIVVRGFQVKDESTAKFVKTVFEVDWEDMKFVFLGHLSNPLPAAIQEELAEPDFLFLPTGESHFLSPEDGAKIVKQLEPKVIVPAYYKSANDLVKALGIKANEQEKLVFKKKDIPELKGQLIVLESKG